MPLVGIAEVLGSAGPWVILAVLVLAAVIVGGGVFALRVALRGTPAPARPDIIRALGDFFRSLWGRK